MRRPDARAIAAGLALAVGLGTGCASAPSGKAATVVVASSEGFLLEERVRVPGAVRDDFARGVAELERGERARGIATLEAVTTEAPALTAAWIDLAIAYREDGRPEKAAESLERALELSPKHPVALNEQGMVQRRLGKLAEARASYERALEVLPGFHFAHRNLAILCDLYLADTACALENYERYAAAVPEDTEVARWIADLRNRSQDQEAMQ